MFQHPVWPQKRITDLDSDSDVLFNIRMHSIL